MSANELFTTTTGLNLMTETAWNNTILNNGGGGSGMVNMVTAGNTGITVSPNTGNVMVSLPNPIPVSNQAFSNGLAVTGGNIALTGTGALDVTNGPINLANGNLNITGGGGLHITTTGGDAISINGAGGGGNISVTDGFINVAGTGNTIAMYDAYPTFTQQYTYPTLANFNSATSSQVLTLTKSDANHGTLNFSTPSVTNSLEYANIVLLSGGGSAISASGPLILDPTASQMSSGIAIPGGNTSITLQTSAVYLVSGIVTFNSLVGTSSVACTINGLSDTASIPGASSFTTTAGVAAGVSNGFSYIVNTSATGTPTIELLATFVGGGSSVQPNGGNSYIQIIRVA